MGWTSEARRAAKGFSTLISIFESIGQATPLASEGSRSEDVGIRGVDELSRDADRMAESTDVLKGRREEVDEQWEVSGFPSRFAARARGVIAI